LNEAAENFMEKVAGWKGMFERKARRIGTAIVAKKWNGSA
jgi:hypothetical protein